MEGTTRVNMRSRSYRKPWHLQRQKSGSFPAWSYHDLGQAHKMKVAVVEAPKAGVNDRYLEMDEDRRSSAFPYEYQ